MTHNGLDCLKNLIFSIGVSTHINAPVYNIVRFKPEKLGKLSQYTTHGPDSAVCTWLAILALVKFGTIASFN